MFVSESNNPLENDEIRPLKQTIYQGQLRSCLFQLYLSVFIAIWRKVQKEQPELL